VTGKPDHLTDEAGAVLTESIDERVYFVRSKRCRVGGDVAIPTPQSGRIEARTGLRMMPTSPRSPLSFRTAGFPRYGWKAGLSDGAFPRRRSA